MKPQILDVTAPQTLQFTVRFGPAKAGNVIQLRPADDRDAEFVRWLLTIPEAPGL